MIQSLINLPEAVICLSFTLLFSKPIGLLGSLIPFSGSGSGFGSGFGSGSGSGSGSLGGSGSGVFGFRSLNEISGVFGLSSGSSG